MPKQILADYRLSHMVDLQQFYMAMSVHHLLHAAYLYSPISLLTHRYIRRREVDPDNLNKVHRSGSVPPLLAITKGDHTVLREILLILLLLKDVPYIDECTGCNPSRGKKDRPAFFAGSYHILTKNGTIIPGAGNGILGAVGIIIYILKSINILEYEYIIGTRDSHRKDPPEKEFEESNCF